MIAEVLLSVSSFCFTGQCRGDKRKKRGATMGKRTYRTPTGRKRARQQQRAICLIIISIVFIVLMIFLCRKLLFPAHAKDDVMVMNESDMSDAPDLDVQLLTVNEYSRPQIKLEKVKGIVIHYTANPGSTAQENRNYFDNLKDSHEAKASSHFVIGLDGEIIQCIPSSELSYASNDRNSDTLAIECCHPDESGEFTGATYQSMVELTGWLCKKFDLKSSDIIRHYDITGKDCPKYFVENEDAWEQFKKDVSAKIKE